MQQPYSQCFVLPLKHNPFPFRKHPLAVAASNAHKSHSVARAASPPSIPKQTANATMRLRSKFEKMRAIELQQSEFETLFLFCSEIMAISFVENRNVFAPVFHY
jgi:hypothetical protein